MFTYASNCCFEFSSQYSCFIENIILILQRYRNDIATQLAEFNRKNTK